MEAIIHLRGDSHDVVKLAHFILKAAKLFHTEAGLGSKSDVIFDKEGDLDRQTLGTRSGDLSPRGSGVGLKRQPVNSAGSAFAMLTRGIS
jgi:hypothetical protein